MAVDDPISAEEALAGINEIRNSIVGLQTVNWSEHIYPLVDLLNRAGQEGLSYPEAKANFGTILDQRNEALRLLEEITSRWSTTSEPVLKVRAFFARCGHMRR